MLADSVVIVALHYIERGMKAEKALREMEAAQELQEEKETGKAIDRGQKGAQLQNKKQAQRTQKHQSSNNQKTAAHIQQPGKRD
jgi:hypothetical protein